MDAVLNVALPVFAIMATGWLTGHFGLLGPQGSETLNRFVYYAALPTGGLVFILARKYDIYLQRSTSVILISTVLSVPTLSAVMIYYLPS